jgi:hypothetical protein
MRTRPKNPNVREVRIRSKSEELPDRTKNAVAM